MKKLNFLIIAIFCILPSQSFAANNNQGEYNFDGLNNFIKLLLSVALTFAPILITASYAVSALVWITAGTSKKRVEWARKQFIATSLALFILAAYFSIKTLFLDFILN